jgi:hypothetical protein
MNIHLNLFRSIFGKAAIASAVLGGFLVLAGAPGAKANDWDDYHRRPAYSDWRYRQNTEQQRWADERHEAFERREHHDRDRRFDDRYDRR